MTETVRPAGFGGPVVTEQVHRGPLGGTTVTETVRPGGLRGPVVQEQVKVGPLGGVKVTETVRPGFGAPVVTE